MDPLRLIAPLSLGIAALTPAAVRAQPAPVEGPLQDGGIALESGRLDDAERWYLKALDDMPRASDRAWAWLDLCITRYAAGAYGAAIDACYRALAEPATEPRVVMLLAEIRRDMQAAQLDVSGLILPEPTVAWFDPDSAIKLAVIGAPPPEEAGVNRDAGPAIATGAAAVEPIAVEAVERLRGPRPPLPYDAPPQPHDYSVGYDLELKTGALFYGPDTTPFVVGARVARKSRLFGAGSHQHTFVEYLQAIDGTGGIGAVGVGAAAENGLGFETALSVPWGKDERRQHATFPGYTTALHAEARLSYRRELMVGWSTRLSVEVSISGGFNIAKALIRLGDAFGDVCTHDDADDCPKTPDGNPQWPGGHWMVNLSFGLGTRRGYARYDHAEIWAPAGGPP